MFRTFFVCRARFLSPRFLLHQKFEISKKKLIMICVVVVMLLDFFADFQSASRERNKYGWLCKKVLMAWFCENSFRRTKKVEGFSYNFRLPSDFCALQSVLASFFVLIVSPCHLTFLPVLRVTRTPDNCTEIVYWHRGRQFQ